MKTTQNRSYLRMWVPISTDQYMPPAVMIAYLSYRLRLLEAEIESMEQLLGHKSDIAGDQNASWSWDQRRRHERRWASLTHLNYLRTARDTLRRALYML